MDIKKLQALVVDALEDVKAQDIHVYDTTHLTSMFDRIAIASGTSNRQTKALAASVRDKVKEAGGEIVNMEGEGTGEWVLVDLGDMVVHIMQPAIRAYYRLEEIWGDKEVSLAVAKRGATARKTAAKADGEARAPAKKAPAKKAAAKTTAKTAAKKAPAKKSAASEPAVKAPARKAPAKKAAARTTTARKTAAKTPAKAAAKKAAPRRKASED
jgi:ribosome-associated protein